MKIFSSRKRFIAGIIVLIMIFSVISISIGPLPPVDKLLNPNSGIYSVSPQYRTGARYINITQDGRTSEVITFQESDGFIGIYSPHNWSLYYEQGYLEAKYRLAQMVFIKKEAQGNLSSLVGKSELQSDIFSREIMDCQIASEEVHNLSRYSYTYMATSNFVDGINAYINNLSYKNTPLLFKLLNYKPGDFNITNIFAIQQTFLWENSAGGFDPLYFQYALQQIPENVIKAIYPAYPAGIQNPIVPYQCNPSVYNETGDINNLTLYTPSVNIPLNLTQVSDSSPVSLAFPSSDSFSNDWAVNGIKTDNVSALLANDPHLTTSVPSIWIGFQLVSPGQNVIGVVFPGFPGIILGHNNHLAWGATNGQIQETYFYAEETSPSHPGSYYSNGKWVKFKTINEIIPVKGSSPYHLRLDIADNGVVIEDDSGVKIAMDWTGLNSSYELTFFLHIDRSHTVNQFRQNLTKYFRVAIQNWAVADSKGNIGIFPYGEYPVISNGDPRGVLNGTGQSNWVGFVTLRDEPYLYDPARGFVFSDNQITVSPNYPYYIGWDYESGYRADEAHLLLNTTSGINTAKMENIQLTIHDYTTNIFLKPLLNSIEADYSGSALYRELQQWNGNMTVDSTAATVFYFWEQNLVNDTFLPYMHAYGITSKDGLFNVSFFIGPDSMYHGPLIEDLVNWTLNDPNTSYFDNPVNGQARDFTSISLEAYNQTLAKLIHRYGSNTNNWHWGDIHKRYLSSFFGVKPLNTKTVPAAGDGNTINAAYGMVSDFGPSWRLVVNLSHPESSMGIYPGGISENPLSNYYSNNFIPWNKGVYYRLIPENMPKEFYYGYGGSNE